MLLNGRPFRFRGVLDQAYWPDGVYTAPSADALRADVEAVKELGFDLARMHVKVADPRWYAWCAALGVRFPCSAESVKAAYRRLALACHPDSGGDPAEFRAVERAYREALAFFAQAGDAIA